MTNKTILKSIRSKIRHYRNFYMFLSGRTLLFSGGNKVFNLFWLLVTMSLNSFSVNISLGYSIVLKLFDDVAREKQSEMLVS